MVVAGQVAMSAVVTLCYCFRRAQNSFGKKHDLNVSAAALNRTLRLAPTKQVPGYPPATPCGIHPQPVTSAVGALSVPAVIAATIAISAITFLAVPANVAAIT